MFTKLSASIKNDLNRAAQLWRQTPDKSLVSRIFYLLWRMIRAIVLRVFFGSLAFLKVDANKLLLAWQQTAQHNIAYRVAYLLWRIVRAIVLKSYYSLFFFKVKIKAKVKTALNTRFSRVLQNYDDPHKLLTPINYFLSFLFKYIKYNNSVLHISYMVHIPYYTTRILRKQGMKADYLAMERNPKIWDQSDYLFIPPHTPLIRAWKEFLFFWRVVARYEIIHSHFAMTLTSSGWELPFLKRMGRKIVIHYRGCEIRDREKNMALHPDLNICQNCDYNASICKDQARRTRCQLAEKYGDLFLVTTPDMKDFVPEAIHFPFFTPEIDYEKYVSLPSNRPPRNELKIVHVTAHPGIEGTELIKKTLDRLKKKGYPINFVFLQLVQHDRVLHEIAGADLTIGKMKMGYYANAQIESMFLGVPAVTYVRPEFMTPELESSGLILTTLKDLEQTLEYYLSHPEALEKKRQIARSSILALHNNEKLGRRLVELYAQIKTTNGKL